MKFRLLRDRVVIERIDVVAKTSGGITPDNCPGEAATGQAWAEWAEWTSQRRSLRTKKAPEYARLSFNLPVSHSRGAA